MVKKSFHALLRLYPKPYRKAFAPEMMAVFEQAIDEQRQHGLVSLVCFACSELMGLALGAGREWMARFSSKNYLGGCQMNAAIDLNQYKELPNEVVEAQKRIDALVKNMVQAIATHSFQKARFYSNEERREQQTLRILLKQHGIDQVRETATLART